MDRGSLEPPGSNSWTSGRDRLWREAGGKVGAWSGEGASCLFCACVDFITCSPGRIMLLVQPREHCPRVELWEAWVWG